MGADNKNRRPTSGILSHSPVMAQLLKQAVQVAETDTTVLMLGETGVGKSLLAWTIHTMSPRRGAAFIVVNCGALPVGLIESELFGHEQGAFTSAGKQRIGYFERAHGGTLFLDEVGALPLESQRVLLHILEEDHLTRVGGGESIPVDVRIVAATNCDLQTGGSGRDVPGGSVLPLGRVSDGGAAVAGAAGGHSAVSIAFCASVCPQATAAGADVER